MGGRWGEMPFAALALCLGAGITVSRSSVQFLFSGLALAALFLILAAVLALRKNHPKYALATGLSALFLCGFLLALAQREGFSRTDVRSYLRRGALPLEEIIPFDGCVVEESEWRGGEILSTIELRGIRKEDLWLPCRGTVLLRMPGLEADSGAGPKWAPNCGDRVRGWAAWTRPRNYANPGAIDRVGFLERRGIFLLGRTKSPRLLEVIPGDCATSWKRAAIAARVRLRAGLQSLREAGKHREAAILSSLVVGDYSDLDRATRDSFQNSGTYHVLVVSGLHVAWIALVLLRVFHWLRVPQIVSRLLVAWTILFYTWVVGFQASITRCLWMFVLYLVGQCLFRRASPTNILFASAFLLLVARPDWLFEAGFQLSFLSVMAIGLMGAPLFQQYLEPALRPLRYAGDPDRLFLEEGGWHRFGRQLRVRAEMIAESTSDSLHPALGRCLLAALRTSGSAALLVGGLILVTLSVQLWIEPTLAYHFNRLSWIAPVANLIIVPFSSLVLAAGFIAALAPAITPLISCAGWLSSQLANIAGWISSLPGSWQRCPTPSLYWPLAAVSLLFLWRFLQWRRLWIPCIVPVALLLWLSYGWAPAEWSAGRSGIRWRKHAFAQRVIPHVLRFTFLDVGQGDSIVVRFPDSRAWLIDAGGTWQAHRWEQNGSAFDVGESVVSRYLWWNWITRLDRLILSHPHQDHAGGMPAILGNFAVGRLENGENQTDAGLVELLEAAREQRVSRRAIRAGNEEVLGEVRIRMLHPPADQTRRTQNENSVVLHISFRRFKALLPGDLEKLGERELVDGTWDIGSHLLKVAHHGSRYATLDPLLKRVRPRWAVISSGRNNPFGYPARDTISRLLHQGARPLLTQDLGAITFETDGYHYILAADAGGVLESGLLPEMGAIPPAK